jgi:acetyl esterase/lipase
MQMTACTRLALAVANAPARLSGVTRAADIAYGDDARQRLDVYQPRQAAVAPRPVVVFWYGGSWTAGEKESYRFVGAALAQMGYVAVLPDYRLYPKVKFPSFMDDAAEAVAWVRKHAAEYHADASRIVLMGHSAGAHMAALLLEDPSYLTRAGVDTRYIAALIGLSGPYALTPNSDTLNTIFAAPFQPRDWQPVAHVVTRGPPTLLLHGRTDSVVRMEVSEKFAALLRAQGTEVQLRLYDRCSHVCTLAGLSLPARRQSSSLADVRAFLDRVTGARDTPPTRVD